MKKTSFVCACAILAVAAGCGDPSSPTGTLPQVTGLVVVDSLCEGTEVCLRWNSVPDVDGYRLYWSETTGAWDELVNIVDTTYVDDVSTHDGGAGYYTVLAFKGVDTSEDYADYANTLANTCGSYTLWIGGSSLDSLDAIIFGEEEGLRGIAGDVTFLQDAYCYQAPSSEHIALYSGDVPPYGDGNSVIMANGDNPRIAPASGYVDSLSLFESDRLFIELESGNFVKMSITDMPEDTVVVGSDTLWISGVEFYYWYQPIPNLRIFGSY